MAKFFIFRHAETFPSKNFIIYDLEEPNPKIPILHEGIKATVKMANYLKDVKSDFNVSSPYKRCKQTVKIISKITGKKFEYDGRIGEIYQIDFPEFRKKVSDFLYAIKQKSYQSVIICSHGATISVLMHLLLDKDAEQDIPFTEYKKTGVLIVVENGKIQELDFND